VSTLLSTEISRKAAKDVGAVSLLTERKYYGSQSISHPSFAALRLCERLIHPEACGSRVEGIPSHAFPENTPGTGRFLPGKTLKNKWKSI
jgi:hypothetical protein